MENWHYRTSETSTESGTSGGGQVRQVRNHQTCHVILITSQYGKKLAVFHEQSHVVLWSAHKRYVCLPRVEVNEGVDATTAILQELQYAQTSQQAGPAVLIRDSECNILRVPLTTGGWVTLAQRHDSNSAIRSSLCNPGIDFDRMFATSQCFDILSLLAEEAYAGFVREQELVREAVHNAVQDIQRLVSDRNTARLQAFECAQKVCESNLAAQC